MRFEFIADEHVKVKTFLKRHEISKGLLAKIKFSGGNILVNHQPQNAIYLLDIGDKVTIDIPSEKGFESLKAVDKDLSVIYEDEHFLVHIVTRLDKDTSGLMLFAKHGYAHARLDKQLQKKLIEKRYYALVRGTGVLEEQGEIIAPIGRNPESIITRRVTKDGKHAHTSYKVIERFGDVYLVDIHLHTGRTHQIRVHFSYIGFPLLGDDLYGGSLGHGIERQALHCHSLKFYNPFSRQEVERASPLPEDFKQVIEKLKE